MESAGSSSQPILNRDLQILVGEQIFTGICGPGRYISNGFFNLFEAGPTVKSSVVSVLSKMTVFTMNECRAQISSPTDKMKFLCIDFRKSSGYLFLKKLVQIMNESKGKFFEVLHLICLKGVYIERLFDIFLMLNDLTIINLPYEFDSFSRNGETKILDKLIGKNAATLHSIHHLVYPFQLFPNIRNRIIAINSATLRTGTMERECDFFAFYMNPSNCPKEFLPPKFGGISMSISINRCKEVLRSVKRALQRDKLRSEITKLRLLSTFDFDEKSAQILLTQIERIRSTLPKVRSLNIELRAVEFNPNQDLYSNDDFADSNLIPSSASACSHVSLFFLDWMRKMKMGDIEIDGCVRLDVDYHCGEKGETDDEARNILLERTLRETITRAADQLWVPQLQNSVTARNGCASASAEVRVADKLNFKFCIEFRSITYCEMPAHLQENLFRVINSL
ncbi:hypothetical protein niasHT_019692 [Heterodera trifolii]|uniref:Uncharacterized protein n=1 Tax=Heterodera trifolii TaxID=157864 RepID=A0ABD2LBV3_9BILA